MAVTPEPGWWDELAAWLGLPAADAVSLGWPLLLVPERLDPTLRLPDDARHTYHRVAWSAPPDAGEWRASAEAAWASSHRGWTETGLRSTADDPGGRLAESLMIVRSRGERHSWGERERPSAPEPAAGRRLLSLVVDRDDIARFADLVDLHYPIHEDPVAARRLGYPDVLVQGLALLLLVLRAATAGEAGRAEIWFRTPVVAGITVHVSEAAGTWWLRTGDRLAAVARVYPLASRR